MIFGFRVVKVDETDVASPSGPVAAMDRAYAVDGRSSSLLAQLPSGRVFPLTLTPWVSTSVTPFRLPDDALTVTAELSGTSVARSAGETLSTAGFVSRAAVVVDKARCELGAALLDSGPPPRIGRTTLLP